MEVGSYVLIALLGAAAAYGLSGRGKPKPVLSTGKKKLAIACFVVAIGCFALAALMVAISPHPLASH